jgi:catechol 2,3-dioxygenase-like lactoylglutathione lyase family enzyme
LPRALNHVAVSVTDMDIAVKWYRDVMDMTVLLGPIEISVSAGTADPALTNVVKNVFGSALDRFKLCHLSSANGIGVELFQFIEPKAVRREENFEYWKTGFYHIAVTEPDIEKLAQRIADCGGRQRTGILELAPKSGKKICFCEDPFGNIIEIYSHSYEQFWSNMR